MVNLILGIFIGAVGSWLLLQPNPIPWYAYCVLAFGAASVVFAFDVLVGSFKEHEPRAAWMGLGIFGSLGAVMILVGWGLAF
jgi:uncharacterized membrane protein YccC